MKKVKKDRVLLNNRQIIFGVVAIVIGLTFLFGATYAVLKTTNRAERKNVLTTGTFQVDFDAGEVIQMNNMGPMSEEEGMNTTPFKFTITNNSTSDKMVALYKIFLDENSSDISTVPNKEYIMISYKINDGSYSKAVSIEDLYDSNTLVLNKFLGRGESVNYEIKIWLDKNATNEYQNTTYSARVAVESSQIVYDIATDEYNGKSLTLEGTKGIPALNYKIYGNNSGVGDVQPNGKYKIGIITAAMVSGSNVTNSDDIYLEQPLRKYDEEHVDYIDFDNLEVVRYTKLENGNVVAIDEPIKEKISLPYINTYNADTTITIVSTNAPSKIEVKYFKL